MLLSVLGTGWGQSIPVVQDAFVAPGSGANYGSLPTLNVGGRNQFQGLLLFDFAPLPANTTGSGVAKATLLLYVNKIGTAGAVNIDLANGAWTEGGVTGTAVLQQQQSVL